MLYIYFLTLLDQYGSFFFPLSIHDCQRHNKNGIQHYIPGFLFEKNKQTV